MASIIGKNLERAKTIFQLDDHKLAELMKVSESEVRSFYTGEQLADSAKLFRISRFCKVPLKFFLEEEEQTLSFMFRADNPKENFTASTAAMINQKLLSVSDLSKRYHKEKDVYLPESHKISIDSEKKLSAEEKELINKIAKKVRRAMGLVRGNVELDIYQLLEKYGIHVIALPLPVDTDGLSAYDDDRGAFILINDRINISEERKRFSCAHELGHLILHRDDYKRSTEELTYEKTRNELREKMANTFASYFLMPRSELKKAFTKAKGRQRMVRAGMIYEIKQQFGVSAQSVILALKEEGLITAATYGSLKKQFDSEYGTEEPRPMKPIVKNKKFHTMLKHLAEDGEITLNKVAEMLDIPYTEVQGLMRSWELH